MSGLSPKRVKKQTGMNSVARAVARDSLRKAILDQKLQLYMTQDGARCAEFCTPMLMLMSALLAAAKADPKIGIENYESRLIRGAVSALSQMIADDSYRQANTISLELGLDCAQTLAGKLNPEAFTREWNKLTMGA